MARRPDGIDQACEEWAATRRELLGLRAPRLASQYIGSLRCTLAARRDLHAGSTSSGRVEQHFPELYVGRASTVNRAYWAMSPSLKEIMDAHYVVLTPRNKTLRAELLGLSPRLYWDRVARAKCVVEGALSVTENVRAFRAEIRGI